MELSWHSGIKKIVYVLCMAVGGYLSLKYPDIMNQFDWRSAIAGLLVVGGAGSLIVEAKRDKAAEAERVNSVVTTEVLNERLENRPPSFDAITFHNLILLPIARDQLVRLQRKSLACSAYYAAETVIQPDTPSKAAYLLGLARGAFQTIVGFTWEGALANVPVWRSQCIGSTFDACMRSRLDWYYIYKDITTLNNIYNQIPPADRPPIFDPQWTALDIGTPEN